MNYYYPLIFLTILLIALHFLFVRIFPLTKKDWKKAEYVWITFSLLGILGSMNSLSKEVYISNADRLKNNLLLDINELEHSVKWNENYFSENTTNFNYPIFKNQNQASEFKKAGIFFKNYSDLIIQCKTNIIQNNFSFIDSLQIKFQNFQISTRDEYISETINYVDYILKNIEFSSNELFTNQSLTDKNTLDWFILYLSPYLLSIAIALRFTKVSAELKDLK